MLAALGLWAGLAAHAQAIHESRSATAAPARARRRWFLHFDHREIDEGPMGHILEDRWLRGALLAAMDAARGSTPARRARSRPAVGAGRGRGDAGRRRAAARRAARRLRRPRRAGSRRGPASARRGWDYGQTSLVCAVAHARPHRGVAHQFFMPAGPLAILPLPGNRSSIVWTEARDRAAAIEALDDAGYLAELRPRFGDFLGEIGLAGARYTYPLGLSLAERLVAAAAGAGRRRGARHPSACGPGAEPRPARRRGAGRGAGGGAPARPGHRRGRRAADYQRWRRFDAALLAAATDGLNRLFSNDNPLLRLGRDLGLGLVNRAAGAAPRPDPRGGRPDRRPAAPAAGPAALSPRRISAGQRGRGVLMSPPATARRRGPG